MSATLELVRRMVTDQGLDVVEVWNQRGSELVAEGRGANALAVLDEVAGQLTGTYRVEAYRDADVSANGTVKKGAKAYRWSVVFGNVSGPAAMPAAGPSWAEFIDLRLQLQEKTLREELAGGNDGAMDRIAGLLEKVLTGGQAPTPATPPAPAPAQPGQDAGGELPPEVLEAARNVALLYRRDPAAFRQYAPILANMVKPPATDES